MTGLIQNLLQSTLTKAHTSGLIAEASAHCDVPCGVYDPIPTQIAAMTVARMTDTLIELENHYQNDHGGKLDATFRNKFARMVAEKERSAEHVKHEVRIIWGDYVKAAQIEKFPKFHELSHQIMMTASKCKQNVDVDASRALVDQVNQFAAAFWDAKGIAHKKAKYHCKPNLEVVWPEL
jgi:nickel superoxide dismutase